MDSTAHPLVPLRQGGCARLCGLRAKPQLNGEVVKLGAFKKTRGRWQVTTLWEKKPYLVKPANLTQITQDEHDLHAPRFDDCEATDEDMPGLKDDDDRFWDDS